MKNIKSVQKPSPKNLFPETIEEINLSIDDISPHPQSSTKCLKNCLSLLKDHPNIKFTLFVPTNYTRFGEGPYDIRNYPAFINEIKNLPDNFEIGYHGHLHGIKEENFKGEFGSHTNYASAIEKFNISKMIFDTCGIKVKPIFRPPGFGLAPNGFAACEDFGIKVVSLHPQTPYYKSYKNVQRGFNRVIYIDIQPPQPLLGAPGTSRNSSPQNFSDKKTLSVIYHACEWSENYFSETRMQELAASLRKNLKYRFTQDFYNG